MKISIKLPLVQLILTTLFITSLGMISVLFIRSSNLMLVSARINYVFEESQILKTDLELLPLREGSFDQLEEDLLEQEAHLDRLLLELEQELEKQQGPYAALNTQYHLIYQNWLSIRDTDLLILEQRFNQLKDLVGPEIEQNLGIEGTLAILDPQVNNLAVDRIEKFVSHNNNLIRDLDFAIIGPLQDFVEFTDNLIETLRSRMFLYSLLISTGTLLSGVIIGLILARRISRNVNMLDKSIGQVASGDIHFSITPLGSDEFREIGEYFNNLTDTLWFRLDSLKDIMRDLGSSVEDDTDQGTLLGTILELAIDSTGAESGIVLFFNEEEKNLKLEASMGNFPLPVEVPQSVMGNDQRLKEWYQNYHMQLGETLIGEAAQRKTYFFVRDNKAQGLFPHNTDPDSSLFISSSIILPLMNEDSLLGVMVLGKNSPGEFFTELDYTFMKSYSRFVTITLDNFRKYQEVVHKHEINREIGVAAEIQKTLLPGRLPRMKALQIGAYSDAAKGVSGDYYDVFPLDGNKMAIIICDVSGKGIPASLFMVMIRTVIRTISSPSMNAAQILQSVNQEITGNFRTGTFATISLLIVDQKRYEMSYANGAHHPLYLYRARTKRYLKFDADGLPLGIDIHANFGHKRIKIEPNDYLLLFTDGLPEARNLAGEELSTGRLLQYALKYTGKGAAQMKDRVRDYLKAFCKGTKQHDDETFVAIKII